MRTLTKSTLAFAREALLTGKGALPDYSHSKSPHKFTQPQLFAILALRVFLRTDFRGIIVTLSEWSDLRALLGLKSLPHYSTLCYAERRLLKKNALISCLQQASSEPASSKPSASQRR